MELTLYEFAEVLNMTPEAEFVQKMFYLIDKSRNNFISFREFVDLLVIFADGDADKKLRLLFDMYDINAVGYLTKEDFASMIKSVVFIIFLIITMRNFWNCYRSFLETVKGNVEPMALDNTLETMMRNAGLMKKVCLLMLNNSMRNYIFIYIRFDCSHNYLSMILKKLLETMQINWTAPI